MIRYLVLALLYLAFLIGGKFSLALLLLFTFFALLLFIGLAKSSAPLFCHPSLFLFCLFLFAYALLYSLFSPDLLKSLSFASLFLLGIYAAVLIPSAMTAATRFSLLALLLLPTAIAVVDGFFQYSSMGSHYLLFSTYFNPNIFAGFLIMVIPLIFVETFSLASPGWRFRFLLVLLVSIIALFMTQSRGAILSLLLAVFLLLPRFRKVFPLLLLLLICLPLFFYLHPLGRAKWAPTHLLTQRSVLFRELVYKSTLHAVAHHPLGMGTYTFSHFYPTIKLGGVSTLMAHNSYLQFALEWGFLGFFIFLWFCFTCSSRRSPAIQVALLAFFFHNLVDYTFVFPSHFLLLLFLVALDSSAKKQLPSLPASFRKLLLGFALLLLLPILLLYQNQLLLETADDLYRSKKYAASQAQLAQMTLARFSFEALILKGKNALFLSQYQHAKYYFQQALRLDKSSPQALFHLGLTALYQKNLSQAIAYLKSAHKKKPTDLSILKELGFAYLNQRKIALARHTFTELLKTSRHPYQSNRYAPIPGMLKNEEVGMAKAALAWIDAFERSRQGKK